MTFFSADGHCNRVFALVLLAASLEARAIDVPVPIEGSELSLSSFGTIGYARSDRSFTYQRFIDNDGTIRRDSVVGVQADFKLNNEIGATVQLKGAPRTDQDKRYEASVSWAFLSYRPTNDLLLRVGKQRSPFYLYSESFDVGTTFDFARLPTEMYSISPSNDFTGIAAGKTWRTGDSEISLDAYGGQADTDFRVWSRDQVPGLQTAGAQFVPLRYKNALGLVLSYRSDDTTLRLVAVRSDAEIRDGRRVGSSYPFVSIAPGIGYYQVADSLPGPGVDGSRSVRNAVLVAGAEVKLPADFRVISEFARTIVKRNPLSPQGNRGYVSLLQKWDQWKPYVTYAFLKSPKSQRDFYAAVNGNRVPAFIPGADLLNASQRIGADNILVYDQTAVAIGASYAFSPTSKLKAEILRTRVGDVSMLVDAPPGGDVRNRVINVLSINYSVVFQ